MEHCTLSSRLLRGSLAGVAVMQVTVLAAEARVLLSREASNAGWLVGTGAALTRTLKRAHVVKYAEAKHASRHAMLAFL